MYCILNDNVAYTKYAGLIVEKESMLDIKDSPREDMVIMLRKYLFLSIWLNSAAKGLKELKFEPIQTI